MKFQRSNGGSSLLSEQVRFANFPERRTPIIMADFAMYEYATKLLSSGANNFEALKRTLQEGTTLKPLMVKRKPVESRG
jgi:hypothetical protein